MVIQSAARRSIPKFSATTIEQEPIPFAATPRIAIPRKLNDRSPGRTVTPGVGLLLWRHDLPPEETSQVVRASPGKKAVCHREVFPAVVVDVHESGAPGPAPEVRARRITHLAKSSNSVRLKERIATCHPLQTLHHLPLRSG